MTYPDVEFHHHLIRLLTIMRKPFAFSDFHFCKCRLKRRIFRTAGIDTKLNLANCIPHMADSHLFKTNSIFRTFNAIVILTSAEAIPHGFNICADFCRCPVRISSVCHNTSQMLILFVFIFYGTF